MNMGIKDIAMLEHRLIKEVLSFPLMEDGERTERAAYLIAGIHNMAELIMKSINKIN